MVDDLLTSLKEMARWETAFHTFGSNHYSLIGLLVDWWIHSGPRREALEAPPWYASQAENGRPCDAIFIEDGICTGTLEVEGTKYIEALDRMLMYLGADNLYWQLEFGLFLAYPTTRQFMEKPLPMDMIVEKAKVATIIYPIQLLVLTLDKKWDPQAEGPRTRGPRGLKNHEHDYESIS